MATEKISINLDADIKKQAQNLFENLGMDFETAITIFLKQSIREKAIPFKIGFSKENVKPENLMLSRREIEESY